MVLKSRIAAPDWGADHNPDKEAFCRKHPLPGVGSAPAHDVSWDPWFHDMTEAVHVCNGTYTGVVCPFRARCTHISLINNEGSGVFGGLLPIQRKWVRKNPSVIPKSTWEMSEEWRSLVPPLEYFEELERISDDESEPETLEDAVEA